MSVLFAAKYPDRAAGLVVVDVTAGPRAAHVLSGARARAEI